MLVTPFYSRIEKKEEEKNINYNQLKYKVAKIWRMKKVDGIPVVIVALGSSTGKFEIWTEKLECDLTVEMMQKPCLVGPAIILEKMKRKKESESHYNLDRWLLSTAIPKFPGKNINPEKEKKW